MKHSKETLEIFQNYQIACLEFKTMKYKIQMYNILLDFCKRKNIPLENISYDFTDIKKAIAKSKNK